MEVTFRTAKGRSVQLEGLDKGLSIHDVKHMLHTHWETPEPDLQRLVFKGRVLRDNLATLADAGLESGNVVVVLVPPMLPPPPDPVTTPAPDSAAIRAAIAEEARLRGIDPATLSERPGATAPRAAAPGRRTGGITLDLPPELLELEPHMLALLQQALEGSGLMGTGIGEHLAAAGGGGEEGGAGELDFVEEDVVPPEPPAASVQQLQDMGFGPPALLRKALLLGHNRVDVALEWLLQHAEEPGAAEPPTREQLRAVWGVTRRRPARQRQEQQQQQQPPQHAQQQQQQHQQWQGRTQQQPEGQQLQRDATAVFASQPPVQPPQRQQQPGAGTEQPGSSSAVLGEQIVPQGPAAQGPLVDQLVEMGFAADTARRALRRFGGRMDVAVAYLLGLQEAGSAAGGAQPPAAGEVRAPAQGPAQRTRDVAGAGTGGGGIAQHSHEHQQQRQRQQQQQAWLHEELVEDLLEGDDGFGLASDEYEAGGSWTGGEDEEEELVEVPDGGGDAAELIGNALGNLGSMDLAQLLGQGSADMEQLLQGIGIDELMGSQLFPGAVEPGSLGTNAHDVLLRIMESPALLQQALAGAAGATRGAQQQLGQPQGQGRRQGQQQHQQQQQGPSQQQ